MGKAYTFKRLTNQVKHFAVLMLIMLMAVGNLFAEQVTFVFSEQGYSDAQIVESADFNDVISFTAAKNSSNTPPKYYNNGAALRLYGQNSFTLTPALGYVITGVSFTAPATGSNAPQLKYTVDNSELAADLPAVATDANKVYTISGIQAYQNVTVINPNSSGHARVIAITVIYEPAIISGVAMPTVTPVSGTYYTPQQVQLSCETPGANIYYSINDNEPVLYAGPFTVNSNTTLTAFATLGEETSASVTVNYVFPIQVNNIAEFYQGEQDLLYQITGDVKFVWRNGQNMYVQDETGGLLVYDNNNPVITTQYNNGDVISGGIYGTLDNYNGLIELKPTLNTAEGVPGNAIVPVVATVAQILENPEQYMSKLVIISGGEFTQSVNFTNGTAKNVNYAQGENTIQVRSQFRNIIMDIAAGTPATVMGFVGRYNNTIQFFPRFNDDIICHSVPTASNFEGASAFEWTIVNGDNINKWYIGQAVGFDDNKLYISSSNGQTNKYNVSVASDVHAYFEVTLPSSDVLLTFNCRAVGNEDDYLQVSVMDEAPVAGVLPTEVLGVFHNIDEFTNKSVLIPASYAGQKYVVFTWHNDVASGAQSPAAIDNVMMVTTCTTPTNVEVTVNDQTATVTWTAPEDQNAWTVEYKSVNADVWQTVEASATTVALNNLSTEVDYQVRVKANCGDNSSAWAGASFNVPCMGLTTSQDEITIGTGTSTSSTTPMNAYYKNSWTQMIYPASEFSSPGYINSLSWYVNTTNTHNYNSLKIYIGTKASAINESTTDWVPMEDLTLVYESYNGTVGSSVGWETFTLNTPYYYNGEENLVIVTARTADAYKSLNYRYTSVTNSVLYRRSDSSPESYGSHPGTNSGTRAANLPNMLVDFTGYVCTDEHCAAPANLTVSEILTESAVLSWEAGNATAWQVNYKPVYDDEWTTVNVTENTYALTNLNQNTNYIVRVLTDCGTVGMSEEALLGFTTDANCVAPQNLEVETHAHTANVSWLPVEGVHNYEVEVKDENLNVIYNQVVANVSQVNLTGLQEGALYFIFVRAFCNEEETSTWSTYNFVMPTICPAPASINVVEKDQNSATIVWNVGDATSWVVEYGLSGFVLGEGTQVMVNDSTVTLTGLNPYASYDVYVKADCGLGYVSTWSNKTSFKTECGPILVTEANPWVEDFESYSGSGNLAFDDCWATPMMSSYNSPFIYRNYATTAHSGVNTAELKANNGDVAMLVLPAFVNPLSDLQFEYYGMVTGTNPGTMELGYITDVTDGSTFVTLQTVPAQEGSYNRANSLYYGPFVFNGEIPEGARITLKFTSATSNCSWNLDDFVVSLKPDCQVPTQVTVTATTTSSATLAWQANGPETAWNIEYGPAGFEIGEGTVVAADANPFIVTDLADATAYDFYVQANCGAVTSTYSAPATGTTLCLALNTPYTEDFEGYPGTAYNVAGVAPTCWDTYINGTSYPAPHVNNGTSSYCYAQSGQGLAFTANTNANSAFAILPLFEKPMNTLTLSFWRRMESATSGELSVGYVTSTDNPVESYVELVAIPSVSSSAGADYLVDFSAIDAVYPENARIAFRWYRDAVYYSCGIDNVEVTSSQDASCFPVADLTVSNVTSNSADLAWTPGLNETSWFVSYKAENDEDWTTVETTANPYTLTGLAGLTTYNVKVAPNCDGQAGPESVAELTTLCGNPCDFTFVLHDSYGDGWNGNGIVLSYSNGTSETVTLSSGNYGIFNITIPDGATMTCNWQEGSYASETSFEILDGCGTEVYAGSGVQTNGFYTAQCPMPACPQPTNVVASNITGSSAIITWTSVGEETAWVFEYKAESEEEWTVAEVTATTYPLLGLEGGTLYDVRVKANCGNETSKYASASFTTCYDGCVYQFNLHDSYGDGWNGNAVLVSFTDGTSQSLTIDNGHDASFIVTIPAGDTMTCSWVTGNYSSEASFNIVDIANCAENSVFQSESGSSYSTGQVIYTLDCAPPTCPAPIALTASAVENGACTLNWFAGGDETLWAVTYGLQGETPTTDNVTSPTFIITGMNPSEVYEVSVKAICSEEDESEVVTTTIVVPAMIDIALVDVYTNPSNCDLSNAIAQIRVTNLMEDSPISSFQASYYVNDGETVTETVNLITPMLFGDTITYTFTTAPVMTDPYNMILASVFIEGETSTENNTKVSGYTYLTEAKSVPYAENFSDYAVYEWAAINGNNDASSMTITDGAIHFTGSDVNVANDLMVSPCIDELNFHSDIYLLSYDYKASSSYFDEQFSVYLNENIGFDGNERLIGTHTFNNTDYVHVVERTNYLNVMEDEILTNAHIMFKAESATGTDGFSIDNVSLKQGKMVIVTTDDNGTADVISNDKFPMVMAQNFVSYLIPVNDDAIISIEANEGYHVSAIYKRNGSDWELVRAENPNNAVVDLYSFVVGDNSENYYRVTFAPNSYTVNATVNNLYNTSYNNNAPGATYTPAHENVAHGGSHTGIITVAPNYHLEHVTVNDMGVTPVPSNINGQYYLTLDPVMENKNIEVLVEIDSTYIVYTVNGGQGTINGHYVVDGTATYPVVYTEALVGYSNFLTSVVPAPGYHVASIIIDGVEHTNISHYYFEHLFGTHTVVVLFEKNHYTITTAGYGNGTVSAGADFDYDPEHTYTFTATPDAGYRIASIYRNNVALAVNDPVTGYTETLTNILSDYNYQVHFVQNLYTVTATSGLNGTVTPAGTTSYVFGQDVEYNVNANQGYYIASVTVDGEPILFEPGVEMTSYTYTFANIAEDHTISATFAQKMFTVTVNAGAHGTITPATASYAYGTDVTFNIAPAAGYTIADVTVDGISVGAVSSYTIPYITSNHTIAATFAASQYTINASASVGGTITPEGATLVAHNGSQNYTIVANAGYHVAAVYVDGASVGAVNSYNFTNVTADHQIYAAFEADAYTVTVNQPLHGTITPGTTTVAAGATPAFVITPDLGYEVTQITVNGSNVALANVPNVNGIYTYTFAAVNANQTIAATMTAKTFTINATAGANGSISPNGNSTVAYGGTKSYTITPNAGYEVNNVTVDGMNMGAITSYTFTNVTANHTINATFKLIDCEVPTFLYTSHIDDNSAMLHWSHPTATSFDIQYKTATSNFTSIGNVSGNSYQVTDLNPNTTYMWQVRANCSANNHSDWSNLVTFKTENTPIEIGIEDLVKNNIKVYGEHQNVHILNPEGMNIENVRIFDAYGRLIYSGAVSSSHEVIGLNVAAGTYIVNVTTDQGVANYKVMIMK